VHIDGRFDPSTKINFQYHSTRYNTDYYCITKDKSSSEELSLELLSLKEGELLTKSAKAKLVKDVSEVLLKGRNYNAKLAFVGR
jgi:hypothetical protein